MENFGVFNSAHGADRFGFRNLKRVFWNLEAPALYEHALANREAQLIRGGALARRHRRPHRPLAARTSSSSATPRPRTRSGGTTTPRSRPSSSSSCSPTSSRHAEGKDLFAQDLFGGADPATRARARVFTEYAWHSLFIRNLLRPPEL